METEEIVQKIQSALKSCAETNGIPTKEVRVRILKEKKMMMGVQMGSELKCELMKKNEVIKEVKLAELFGLNMLQLAPVNLYLKNSLSTFAENENIPDDKINCRFYTTSDDYSPRLYLYNGVNPVREIKISELV